MKCPICKKDLEIKNKKVGVTEDGEPIYNEYGICHDCKKQWNLDKHRAKKKNTTEKTPSQKPKKKVAASKAMEDPIKEFSEALENSYSDPASDNAKKSRHSSDEQPQKQVYSNIPPKHLRESREAEIKAGYQNMLDEEDEDDDSRFPTVLIIILIILILVAASFAGYWFLIR